MAEVLPRLPEGVRPDNARNILRLRIGTGLRWFAMNPIVVKLAKQSPTSGDRSWSTVRADAGTKREFKQRLTGPAADSLRASPCVQLFDAVCQALQSDLQCVESFVASCSIPNHLGCREILF